MDDYKVSIGCEKEPAELLAARIAGAKRWGFAQLFMLHMMGNKGLPLVDVACMGTRLGGSHKMQNIGSIQSRRNGLLPSSLRTVDVVARWTG